MTDLRDSHYSSLVLFVEREHDTREKMRAVASKEEEVMKEVEVLTAKLREEDEKHAAEMETKKAELAELKERLRKLKIDTTLTLRYARKEAAAKTEATARGFTAEESAALAAVEEMRKKMTMELEVHDKEMTVLRADQEEYTRLADEWRVKYAADLAASEAELAKLTGAREQQRQALMRYQERYDKELADLAEQEAEEERERDAAAYATADGERRKAAASQLQRVIGEMFTVVAATAAAEREAKKKAKGEKKKKK